MTAHTTGAIFQHKENVQRARTNCKYHTNQERPTIHNSGKLSDAARNSVLTCLAPTVRASILRSGHVSHQKWKYPQIKKISSCQCTNRNYIATPHFAAHAVALGIKRCIKPCCDISKSSVLPQSRLWNWRKIPMIGSPFFSTVSILPQWWNAVSVEGPTSDGMHYTDSLRRRRRNEVKGICTASCMALCGPTSTSSMLLLRDVLRIMRTEVQTGNSKIPRSARWLVSICISTNRGSTP